ncbi:MAG: 2-amino-4-hydroxy-6-hydroxymethyldihydropteridine diphosphokinase [Thermoanaerobacteraceae bacterium]|nr:2-amino-4-hydroxy-6-hydroxymethyldihydropteridine diphosphokinase [Thermoanaerobacteraceae bacterium]
MSVFISLGSNLGNRINYLQQALALLERHEQITVVAVSSIYETAPVGKTDQGWFLNAVAELETALSPWELLNVLQLVERRLGRRREERWGPRTIDLDILFYDRLTINHPCLTVPHPRAHERAFVLVPLSELAPDFKFPGGKTVDELLSELENSEQKVLFFGKLNDKI